MFHSEPSSKKGQLALTPPPQVDDVGLREYYFGNTPLRGLVPHHTNHLRHSTCILLHTQQLHKAYIYIYIFVFAHPM